MFAPKPSNISPNLDPPAAPEPATTIRPTEFETLEEEPEVENEFLPDHEETGLSAEIAGLRTLLRGLLQLQPLVTNTRQTAMLVSAYTQSAARLAELLQTEKKSADGSQRNDEDAWVEDMLAFTDRMEAEQGRPPISPALRRAAERGELVWGDDIRPGAADDFGLCDEIAAMRCSLRTALRLAGEAVEQANSETLVNLADVYSLGCVRLAKMLRQSAGSRTRLAEFFHALIDQAIETVSAEFFKNRDDDPGETE
jgi:hypothetical protein